LIDAVGKIGTRAGTFEAHLAIRFYCEAFIDAGRFADDGDPLRAVKPWRTLWSHAGEWGEPQWGAVLRPLIYRPWDPPDIRQKVFEKARDLCREVRRVPAEVKRFFFGAPLDLATVLGLFWRARLLNALGVDMRALADMAPTSVNRLFTGGLDGVHAEPALADLLIGWDRDEREIVSGAITEQRLAIPPDDCWWRVARSMDGHRCVIVDIDLHCSGEPTPEDIAHRDSRVRFFTQTPGLPAPHLIVTSKSTHGRHLWYFVERRACMGPACGLGEIVRADAVSRRFRESLEDAYGIDLAVADVEVKPDTCSARCALLPLPFGPGALLCSPDGITVEERDPIAAAVAWRRRFSGKPFPRYQVGDFDITSSDSADPQLLEAMRSPPPFRRREDRECAEHRQRAATSQNGHSEQVAPSAHRTRRASRPSSDCDLDACQREFDEGPEDGRTNEQVPLIARLLKFGPGRTRADAPDERAEADFLAWIHRRGRREESDAWWLVKFQTYWRSWEHPFPSPCMLSDQDVRMAAESIARIAPPEWRWAKRKSLLAVYLFAIGKARAASSEADSPVSIVLHSTHIQRHYTKDWPEYRGLLTEHGFIAEASPARTPRSKVAFGEQRARSGEAAEYHLHLSLPVGAASEVDSKVAILQRVAGAVDASIGARLAGSVRAWRDFVNTFAGMNPPHRQENQHAQS
jgi:hypothetical protein